MTVQQSTTIATQLLAEPQAVRRADHPILPLFLNRWSPRAMTGEPLAAEELFALFEAARWAPSSFNAQPWRFLYAQRKSAAWDQLLALLSPFNRSWACQAGVLLLILARNTYRQQRAPTAAFDTGAAWMNLALEGAARGLVVHGMAGFDYTAARQQLEIPSHFSLLAMAAIGKRAAKEVLPAELRQRERPSTRRAVSELIMEGRFDPAKE